LKGSFVPKTPDLSGQALLDALDLEHAGLLTGSQGFISFHLEPGNSPAILPYRNFGVEVKYQPNLRISIPAMLLTRVGKEVVSILAPKDDFSVAQAFAELVPKGGVTEINYMRLFRMADGSLRGQKVASLWQTPP
jgi:hypothetical protein